MGYALSRQSLKSQNRAQQKTRPGIPGTGFSINQLSVLIFYCNVYVVVTVGVVPNGVGA